MKARLLRSGDRIRRKDGSIAAVLTVVTVGVRAVHCYCDAYRATGDGRVEVPLWDAQHRYERAPTQEAEHIARRKEIWEAMRAKPGQLDPVYGGRGNEGFAASTAKATGKSKETTDRAVRRATEVCQEARDLIRGTKLDNVTPIRKASGASR